MNRKERRKEQQSLNRQIRQRQRALRRKIKEIDVQTKDGYISEQEALGFLERLYKSEK